MEHIELNEWGYFAFKNVKKPGIFAHRSYRWCDRILVLDESAGRLVISDNKFSTFDLTDYVPVTVKEYERVIASKRNFDVLWE